MPDLDELRRLAEAATPGPWTTDEPAKDENGWPTGMTIAAVARGQRVYASPSGGTFPEADRQFIAAANPQTVLALLDELERLRKDAEVGRAARLWHKRPCTTSLAVLRHVLEADK